jgi:transcriptional regulator of acetoin/glycerol metabolism
MAGEESVNRIAASFALAGGERPRFNLDVRLADVLVRHAYRLHVRELEQLLVLAVYGSTGERIELVPALTARLDLPSAEPDVDPEAMSCEALAEALDAHHWNMLATARALGWSRFQLNRKMKKCGLERPPAVGRGRAI